MNDAIVCARAVLSAIFVTLRRAVQKLYCPPATPPVTIHEVSQPIRTPVNQWDDAEEWS
jgi:hypothetical protein